MTVTVNLLAVIAAALSSFVLGGLWYSNALFGAAWRRGRGAERSGDHGSFPLLVGATAVGGGFVVLAALSWLVRVAGWAIDRL